MKQKFLLVLVCVFSLAATTHAQINKGSVWLGGSIGYNQSKQELSQTVTAKTSSLSINPAIGKAVKDNLVVGIKLVYGRDKSENSSSYLIESKSDSYGGGIFVRKYIPVVNRLYVFGDANASYISSKGKNTEVDYNTNLRVKTTTKGWTGGIGLTPGVAFAINKSFQLETTLNNLFGIAYYSSKTSSSSSSFYPRKSSQFTTGIFTDGKVEFNIGCRFLINSKG
jgi:hypothetical protein